MTTTLEYGDSAVAVVGLAGRFPGASDVRAFWANLREGVESVTRFSESELARAGVDPALLGRPEYVRARPVLDGVELFDAAAFGIHAREAALMDPQHRLFLECSLEALQQAGYGGDRERARIGVFAGAGLSSYLLHHLHGNRAANEAAHVGIGNIQDYLATRVAYRLNLRGPAYSVQSACSTSLVAVHLGCQSLLSQECDLALAGGVSIALPLRGGYLYQEGGVLSPDGHCRPFDAAAAGTIFGSGVGVVVLKRFDAALADGDTIHAVVLGSAVNNDGSLKAGFAAPSVSGQAAVIAEALANAGVDAGTIGYVEAHGTGTALGDPVEVAALTQAFREHTSRVAFCGIGSVKSNVGHLDTAAGITGFIKTVLSLHHGLMPPTLHVREPNPRIDFAGSPFYINTSLKPWEGDGPPRAGVSAFGVGGTNAHVVLQKAPARRASGPSRARHLLVLSARTEPALEAATAQLADFLDEHPHVPLADVSFTLQVGRHAAEYRRCVVCGDADEAIDALEGVTPSALLSASRNRTSRSLVFLFPGQDAAHPRMGAGLYRDEPAFRHAVDHACGLFGSAMNADLRPLFRDGGDAAAMSDGGHREAALCIVEYGLVELWRSWGIEPNAMIGQSLGELVAACVAGVMSLEALAAIVAARRRILVTLPPGAMLAVSMPADEVRAAIDGRLSIALVNTPTSCVVAGEADAVARFESTPAVRGRTRRIAVDQALHTPIVEPALGEFEEAFRQTRLAPPRIPFVSNVTGRWVTNQEAVDPRYWTRQLRQTVFFADGIAELLKDTSRVFLEAGPGMALSTITRQNAAPGTSPVIVSSMPDHRERRSESDHVLTSLGRLWLGGVELHWERFHSNETRNRVPLPTYAFDRQRYWIDPPSASSSAEVADAPASRRPLDEWFAVPSWKQVPLPAGSSPVSLSGTWLVLGHEPLADAIDVGIRAAGGRVVRVRHADHFDERRLDAVEIRPGSREDLARLLSTLQADEMWPDAVICTPSALSPAGPESDPHAPFRTVLQIAQALADLYVEAPMRVTVITSDLAAVESHRRPRPAHALAAGALRVVAQELPWLSCRTIDVSSEAEPADVAARIVREVAAPIGAVEVALRGPYRWVRSFESIATSGEAPAPLRAGGVYLITGGTGGIGLTLAEWLLTSVRARVVLVDRSRRAVPASLAAHAANVFSVAANVADQEAMAAAVRQAVDWGGPIDGAIHAAGVAGGGVAALKTLAAARQVFAPKVEGVISLARALDGQSVRFIALCSSLASLAGGVGHIDYCAANAYLDAWAESRTADGGPLVVSINWDMWRDVGMAVRTNVPDRLRQARDDQFRLSIAPGEGVEAFRRALTLGVPRVIVSTLPLAHRLNGGATAAAASPPQPDLLHPRPALQTAFVEARTTREREVVAAWQRALGVGPIGLLDNFFELGGDSVTALRLVTQLRAECQLACSVADFYGAPTIRLLLERLGAEVSLS